MMILALAAALAGSSPGLPPRKVRNMIRTAKSIIQRDGNTVWPDFDKIPFSMILVSPDTETLFCAPPLPGFDAAGADPITGCSVQTRKRVFEVDLAASFDVGDEPSMIVVGLPKTLGLNRTDWVLTVAHEAFHQYQSRQPGYVAKVDALGLAGDGKNGTWMLDYPFPYADRALGAAMEAMAVAGLAFLESNVTATRHAAIADYVKARRQAMAAVTPQQWRYYEFQVGQEGIARWTEQAVARAASGRDPVMAKAAENRRLSLVASLRSIRAQGMRVWKRGAFYEFGAVEGHMLTAMAEPWREDYALQPFAFGEQLERACKRTACAD